MFTTFCQLTLYINNNSLFLAKGFRLYLVSELIKVRFQVFLLDVQETVILHVRGTKREDVDGGQSGLFTRRHKHNDRFVWRVLHDGVVRRPRHGDDP